MWDRVRLMNIKWYLYYEVYVGDDLVGDMVEFTSVQSLNKYLQDEVQGAQFVKVISGYTLAERKANA